MYKSDYKEYKDSHESLSSMSVLNKSKLCKMNSNDTIDTLDSCSHTIRSRANSNSSSIGNSRSSSLEIDLKADNKYNNLLYIEKKECLETPNIEINKPKKRIRDANLIPLSKSPNISSLLEKMPNLNLNQILKERYIDTSSNIIDIK